MRLWFAELDRVLRGKATSLQALGDGTIHVSTGGLNVLLVLLAATYGVCMGFFGLFNHADWSGWQQMAANTVKVPALFLLTLIVTFPSLYVFNALVGSQLTFRALGRLMVAAMSVLLAVLASFGPIVAFFSVTTTSHPFILLLNVACCALAGFLGMGFLLQTLHRMTLVMEATAFREQRAKAGAVPQTQPDDAELPVVLEEILDPADEAADQATSPDNAATRSESASLASEVPPGAATADAGISIGPSLKAAQTRRNLSGQPLPPPRSLPRSQSALDHIPGTVFSGHVKTVFRFWVILFGLVGSQMSWVLRPFIGKANEAFIFFAPRESNFLEAVLKALGELMSWQG